MINEEKQVCYNIQVYNDFVDFPITMTNIEDFEFDKLLSHPNPKVRAFNFIVITKCTTKGNTTTVRPLMIIYNKKQKLIFEIWRLRNGKQNVTHMHKSKRFR